MKTCFLLLTLLNGHSVYVAKGDIVLFEQLPEYTEITVHTNGLTFHVKQDAYTISKLECR